MIEICDNPKCGHPKKDHDYGMEMLCSLHNGENWCKCKKFEVKKQ